METNSPEVAEAEVYYTDWGDGTVTTDGTLSHTYAEHGIYIIKTKKQPGGKALPLSYSRDQSDPLR